MQWLVRLPQRERGLLVQRPFLCEMCMFPLCLHGFSGFLSQSRNLHVRQIGSSKLSIRLKTLVNDCFKVECWRSGNRKWMAGVLHVVCSFAYLHEEQKHRFQAQHWTHPGKLFQTMTTLTITIRAYTPLSHMERGENKMTHFFFFLPSHCFIVIVSTIFLMNGFGLIKEMALFLVYWGRM